MGENPVLQSTNRLAEAAHYIQIHYKKLAETAQMFTQEELKIPTWEEPAYLEGKDERIIDFFLLGNSMNFAFTDFTTFEKFKTTYKGQEWRGSMGMWACLTRAIEKGWPVLDAHYLKQVSYNDVSRIIFEGNTPIPLLEERTRIFREVGRVLLEKYDGHFHNLVAKSKNRLFNRGEGIVERLTNDFLSFDDSVMYRGKQVHFNKRAQLAPAMLYGRFQNQSPFRVDDIGELTVFADYVLPQSLRHLGIFEYAPSLAQKVDQQKLIPANSQEELELRACTIHAADFLVKRVNQLKPDKKVNALHIDYQLWANRGKGNHHLTVTTAY